MCNDKILEPVMVFCPYSKTTINIAPFLQMIHSEFLNFDNAAIEFQTMIEEFSTWRNELMDENPERFRHFIFTLVMLRRSFTNIKTGKIVV